MHLKVISDDCDDRNVIADIKLNRTQ